MLKKRNIRGYIVLGLIFSIFFLAKAFICFIAGTLVVALTKHVFATSNSLRCCQHPLDENIQ